MNWPSDKTEDFVKESRDLIDAIRQFKSKWQRIAARYEKPKGEDSDAIADAEMDLSDAFDSFFT